MPRLAASIYEKRPPEILDQRRATELLSALNSTVPEGTRKSKYWPQNAAQLGNRVSRAGKPLRAKGYIIDRGKRSGRRIITIVPPRGDTQRTDDYDVVPF